MVTERGKQNTSPDSGVQIGNPPTLKFGVEIELSEPTPYENSFSAFVTEHGEAFSSYSHLTRQRRIIEEEGRAEFAPIGSELLGVIGSLPKANSKRLGMVERRMTAGVFDYGQIISRFRRIEEAVAEVDEADKAAAEEAKNRADAFALERLTKGRTVAPIESGMIDAFRSATAYFPKQTRDDFEDVLAKLANIQAKHALRLGPPLIESQRLGNELAQEVTAWLKSDYRNLVELSAFLTDPMYALTREQIRAFMRDFIASDNEARKSPREQSWSAGAREYWQQKGRTEFNRLVFERFWDDLVNSQQKSEMREYLIIGAKIGLAMRDENPLAYPTAQDVGMGMARIPFEEWPQSLKKVYGDFAQMDVAKLVEGEIRPKMQNLFPQSSWRDVSYDAGEEVLESKKRQKTDTAERRIENETSQDDEATGSTENGARMHKLGLIKRTGITDNHTTHAVSLATEGDQEGIIADLVSDLPSPELKRTFTQVILKLLEDPYHRGSRVLNMPVERFTIELSDGKIYTGLYRQFDPRGFEEISSKDPEVRAFRIVYGIVDEAVYIRGIFHHHALTRPRPKTIKF